MKNVRKTIRISVLGGKSAGKTSFLAKLCDTLINKTALKYNATFMPDAYSFFDFNENTVKPLINDGIFPQKTEMGDIKPVSIDCNFFDKALKVKSSAEALLCDISGEGFETADYAERYADGACSAVMAVIDGGALLSGGRQEALGQCMSLYKIVRCVMDSTEKPILAIVLTKCDLLGRDVTKDDITGIINACYPQLTRLIDTYFRETDFFTTTVYESGDSAASPFMWILKCCKIL